MAGRRRVREPATERYTPLDARLDEMELRIRMLEARLREATTELERTRKKPAGKASAPKKSSKPRPRCPGCMLELPKGHRDDSCVWCGFYLPAVKRWAGK